MLLQVQTVVGRKEKSTCRGLIFDPNMVYLINSGVSLRTRRTMVGSGVNVDQRGQ